MIQQGKISLHHKFFSCFLMSTIECLFTSFLKLSANSGHFSSCYISTSSTWYCGKVHACLTKGHHEARWGDACLSQNCNVEKYIDHRKMVPLELFLRENLVVKTTHNKCLTNCMLFFYAFSQLRMLMSLVHLQDAWIASSQN